MTELEVRALGDRTYRVQVRDGALETTHEVTVPDPLRSGFELDDRDLERVVHESFLFLLEREPPSSILTRFSLDDISRYFPEYPEELVRRLG
jgi:hypothetical protein